MWEIKLEFRKNCAKVLRMETLIFTEVTVENNPFSTVIVRMSHEPS